MTSYGEQRNTSVKREIPVGNVPEITHGGQVFGRERSGFPMRRAPENSKQRKGTETTPRVEFVYTTTLPEWLQRKNLGSRSNQKSSNLIHRTAILKRSDIGRNKIFSAATTGTLATAHPTGWRRHYRENNCPALAPYYESDSPAPIGRKNMPSATRQELATASNCLNL